MFSPAPFLRRPTLPALTSSLPGGWSGLRNQPGVNDLTMTSFYEIRGEQKGSLISVSSVRGTCCASSCRGCERPLCTHSLLSLRLQLHSGGGGELREGGEAEGGGRSTRSSQITRRRSCCCVCSSAPRCSHPHSLLISRPFS